MNKIKWTEMFYSVQGEGKFTGQASVFLRLWGCNLQCHGFGQDDPTDPNTWVLDFKEFDPKAEGITEVEQLPVWKRGCDSSYTWAQKYNYLAKKNTAAELGEMILDLLPNREFGKIHLIFTGGEPMMHQRGIIEILKYLDSIRKLPMSVTIETNGTQELEGEFGSSWWDRGNYWPELWFSVSPKLHHVTGEKSCNTIKPQVVNKYRQIGGVWLKPVVVDTDACWAEVDAIIDDFKSQPNLKNVDIYVMPCGATQEEQERQGYMAAISNKALARGWNVSARVHVMIYGNSVGT